MAQYREDFSSYTTGTQPTNWSTFAAVSGTTYLVQDDAAAIGGKKLVITRAVSNENQGFGFDTLNADVNRANVEVLCKFKTTVSDPDIAAPVLRWASGSEKYAFQMYGGAGTERRIRTGVGASYAGVAEPNSIDIWVWFRASAQGTAIKMRYWLDGESEPVAWDIEETLTHTAGPGIHGIETWTGGPYEVDYFSAGTNGDTAPDPLTTSIAQTDTTPEDGVQQTVTCTGMTGPITAATLGGYDILSLLSGTDPASPITYTLDISALAEGTNASLPRLGVSLDLVFTTATDGAVTQSGIVIQPKTGWALVELEDVINKDANGLGATIEADTGITITNVDAVYHETANNASITASLVYTSDLTTAGQSTKIILQDGGTSPATSYSDGFYPYGEASGGGTSKQTLNISNLRIGL